MDSFFNKLSNTDFHDDLHRNIVSIRESQDLFDDLTSNPAGWIAAIDLTLSTKPHTRISHQPAIDRPFEEADFNDAIAYPFKNWSSSRYSNGSYGVWYGGDTLNTTIFETAYHWRTNLLQDAGWDTLDGITIERKVYLVKCNAILLNFRLRISSYPALIDPKSYNLTQQVGSRIHAEGHPGLVTQSARCPGNIFAIFQAQVLSNPRQLCYLTYRTDKGSVVVERQPGKTLLTIQ